MVATNPVADVGQLAGLKSAPIMDKFEIVQESVIEEYGAKVMMIRHKKTGAEIMSVTVPDENKCFGITFRTPPDDSTGIPHILEHSVLCGSRKYPVKEPFVELLKGSMKTFLNAMTYPDRTCYPVASQNLKDFYNLVNVYMDSVLHPAITPWTLKQEGWHYDIEDASQPLTYKGVVYNEMKGVYSSPDSVHGRKCKEALFPDNTYGVDSGAQCTCFTSTRVQIVKSTNTDSCNTLPQAATQSSSRTSPGRSSRVLSLLALLVQKYTYRLLRTCRLPQEVLPPLQLAHLLLRRRPRRCAPRVNRLISRRV
jgi:hypothetical protein